jgi:hypothetical protein
VSSGVVAILVATGAVLVWWVVSGNSFSGPDGNDARYAVPDVDATPPAGEPTGPATQVEPEMSNRDGVRIDGFVEEEGTRLALNYVTGVPECSGTLDTPEVLETDAAVTVTLTLVPPRTPGEPCPDIARNGTVRVDLDTALGGRSVLDGSFTQRLKVEEADRAYE